MFLAVKGKSEVEVNKDRLKKSQKNVIAKIRRAKKLNELGGYDLSLDASTHSRAFRARRIISPHRHGRCTPYKNICRGVLPYAPTFSSYIFQPFIYV